MSDLLQRLPAAPWYIDPEGALRDATKEMVHGTPDVLEFAVLARNALEVMQRRGWWPMPYKGQWYAAMDSGDDISIPVQRKPNWPAPLDESGCLYSDPFTALIKADRWLSEREKEGV